MNTELPCQVRSRSSSRQPANGIKEQMWSLYGSRVSAATANIPSPRLQVEKAPAEQPRLFPCGNLPRKMKRTALVRLSHFFSSHDPKRDADGCLITFDQCETVTQISGLPSWVEVSFLRLVIFSLDMAHFLLTHNGIGGGYDFDQPRGHHVYRISSTLAVASLSE
jgi:hypothetical protein